MTLQPQQSLPNGLNRGLSNRPSKWAYVCQRLSPTAYALRRARKAPDLHSMPRVRVGRGWGTLDTEADFYLVHLLPLTPSSFSPPWWLRGDPKLNAYRYPPFSQTVPAYRGGGGIPRGDFSAGKIPYFKLVRNFPLIFRGEVRNFPSAEFCQCKPPYHRMPCASPHAPICFVPALLQLLSTNREGGAGSRIICERRATPSTEVISGTMVIAFSQDLLGIAIPGSLLLPMH